MTDQEREVILKMIADGKISPEDGLKLMNALRSPAEEPEAEITDTAAPAQAASEPMPAAVQSEPDPTLEKIKRTARRQWQIPLWIGVFLTVASATGMYFIQNGTGMNFWFYCLGAPLLLGIALIAVGVGSRRSRWIFIDVQQKPGEKPEHIALSFPLPLKLVGWFLRTFGHKIPEMKKTNVDDVIQVMETGLSGDEPLVVNVDEGDEGERVKVYIG